MKEDFERPILIDNTRQQAAGIGHQIKDIIRTFPLTANAVKSPMFSITAEGKEVFTERYKTYHYAHFEAVTAFSVSLISAESISDIKISPAKFNISPKVSANTASFNLPGPGYYVVRINQKHKLLILADAPENVSITSSLNILDLGVENKGESTETKAIQDALNKASGSGKTLIFPAGLYRSGSLSIPANTSIYRREMIISHLIILEILSKQKVSSG